MCTSTSSVNLSKGTESIYERSVQHGINNHIKVFGRGHLLFNQGFEGKAGVLLTPKILPFVEVKVSVCK
jgi:hypothetical protein